MEKDLSKMDIVLYALYNLGGASRKVHTEEIAWQAYQLAKEKFSWCLPKFIKLGFPDKLTVLIALETAHKEKHGRLVLGRAGRNAAGKLEGWNFTPQGVKWIKENEERISGALKSDKKVSGMDERDRERFIKKLKSDPSFSSYQERRSLDEVTQYMFTDMLICAPDTSRDVIRQKFEQLENNATLANDKEILCFLRACREKFHDLIV
jgi:hypothetical protein